MPANLTTELLGDLSRGCAWTPRARGPEVIGEGFSLVSARKALFLFDIEGAEFALLTDEVLERLSTSRGVVELHAPLDHPDVRALLERFQRHFVVDLIRMGPRDPSGISMLESWSENVRWLLCSESRAYVMHWLVFKPR